MGATAQPHYNGFRVISDRIITALQCMWKNEGPIPVHFPSARSGPSLSSYRIEPGAQQFLKFFTCAPSKDSDQHAHPGSLISLGWPHTDALIP